MGRLPYEIGIDRGNLSILLSIFSGFFSRIRSRNQGSEAPVVASKYSSRILACTGLTELHKRIPNSPKKLPCDQKCLR